MARLVAELDEVRALERGLAEQDPVVGQDPDRVAVDVGEAGDERRAVELLELVEARAVHEPRDQLVRVVGLADVGGDDAVDAVGVVLGRLGRPALPRRLRFGAQRRDDAAHDRQRVLVVVGQVVGDAARARVQVAAAELLGRHLLAGRRLHERRAAEEDRALLAHDHALVAHRGHVGAAGRAGAEHGGDLRDAARGHRRLVEEDPAEVLAVREDLVLERQERTAGVHEVDARQPVVERHLLRAQVLLDRHRVVRAALDRRVVGDDHALAAADAADAGDDPRAGRVAVIHAVGGERAQLQERRALVHEPVDALARQQLAALGVALARPLSPALRDPRELLAQVGDERLVRGGVGLKITGGLPPPDPLLRSLVMPLPSPRPGRAPRCRPARR